MNDSGILSKEKIKKYSDIKYDDIKTRINNLLFQANDENFEYLKSFQNAIMFLPNIINQGFDDPARMGRYSYFCRIIKKKYNS